MNESSVGGHSEFQPEMLSDRKGRSLGDVTVLTVSVQHSEGAMSRPAFRRLSGIVHGVLARHGAKAANLESAFQKEGVIRVSFAGEADAVQCGAAIQRTLAVSNRGRPESDSLKAQVFIDSTGHEKESPIPLPPFGGKGGQVLLTARIRDGLSDDLKSLCTPLELPGVSHQRPRMRKSRDTADQMFDLRWTEAGSHSEMAKEKAYCLEVTASNGRFRYGFRGAEGLSETVSRYDTKEVDRDKVHGVCREILDIINDANRRTGVSDGHLNALVQCGQRLYDLLLTRETKETLRHVAGRFLILHLDDTTVGIPWELLHDGESFLCRRFVMGRSVATRDVVPGSPEARPDAVTALIIADPQGDLPAAAREGEIVKRVLSATGSIRPMILSGHTTEREVVDCLREHRLLHFCGHAEYNNPAGGLAGWRLADGVLSTADILDLGGGEQPMPSLVFCNACESAQTDGPGTPGGQRDAVEREQRVYGIADAFLLAGTRHYIGALWEVPDEPSAEIARAFYVSLAGGKPVGLALHEAREASIQRFGEGALVWAAYVLYGDPAQTFFPSYDEAFARIPKEEMETLAAPVARMRRSSATTGQSQRWPAATWVSIIAFFLMVALLYAWNMARQAALEEKSSRNSAAVNDNRPSVQEQIAFIAEQLKQKNAALPPEAVSSDGWTSPVLGFAVVQADLGSLSERETRRFNNALDQALSESRRLRLVDRAGIDLVLRELSLAAGQLADPARCAEVGRIIGARLLLTLDLERDTSGGTMFVRLVDTQTTAVLSVPPIPYDSLDKAPAALVEALSGKVEQEFPLRGVAATAEENTLWLNLGWDHGLRAESRITLDAGTGEPVKATVTEAEALRCRIKLDGNVMLREDGRVKVSLLP